MKKFVTMSVLASFIALNVTPVFAIEDVVKKSVATPKKFESMVKPKKNKKKVVSDEYKYEYVNIDWWNNFNDENLKNYIIKAIKNNYDLKMATLAVEEYYQQTKIAFSNELPSVIAGYSPNLVKMMNSTEWGGTFAAPALVSYEADIFLKNHDKTKSSKKMWESSQLDERAAYISIASAVGSVYLNLVELDRVIELQEEIVKNRKEIFELMLLRNEEGITSTADTVRANKAYISGNTELIRLQKSREKLLNQMCVLIGESPENSDTITRISLKDLNYTGIIPEEIASEVIVQRPDYLKAEKMVEKAGIDVRVAKKEFLPTIPLTGLVLFNSPNFGSLFSTKGMLAAVGGAALLPLFTGGAKVANLRLKKATYERILQNYYKTNLTAMQEVNDSLVNIRMDRKQLEEVTKQFDMEKEDYGYSEQKYQHGLISRLDLIQIKENMLVTDKLTVDSQINCLLDYIGLYKAVGSKL